ncbi:hypothetical protein M9458_057838 [Cirrhinus mrigala]|uniref:Uncharacterized protein n=1 Tax=Cirrhinus mrigala TaxID=683832 RepID=A0ABD0MBL5_CIRMR
MLESDVNIPEGVLPKRVLDLLSEMGPPVSADFVHDENVLVYIAGYMASKVVEKFANSKDGPCKECKILTTDIPAKSQYTILKDKQYTDLNLGEKGLKSVSQSVLALKPAPKSVQRVRKLAWVCEINNHFRMAVCTASRVNCSRVTALTINNFKAVLAEQVCLYKHLYDPSMRDHRNNQMASNC